MTDLHKIFWERIHYYGGRHNLSTAIEAELIRCHWRTVAFPVKRIRKCKWSKSEINYLLINWRSFKDKDIALRMNRSYGSVRQMAYYLRKKGLL